MHELCMFCDAELVQKANEITCPEGCKDVGTGTNCQFCDMEVMNPASAMHLAGKPAHYICISNYRKGNK